ncbi:MAG: internal scaffolding protein [Microvirus sp.]|nr:MAG: internal scaffolding protein [Microvirus sp.]
MSKVKFPGSSHDHFKDNRSAEFVEFNREPSLTRQEFLEECDINSVMARYNTHVVGGPGGLPPSEPMYVDFADLPQDLMGYLECMKDAERSFMSLPAVVRKEFENNPIEFVAYASDPANLPQMRIWGLAPPAPPPEAPPAVDAPASPGGAPTHGST